MSEQTSIHFNELETNLNPAKACRFTLSQNSMLDFLKYILKVSSPKKPSLWENYSQEIVVQSIVNLLLIANNTEKEEKIKKLQTSLNSSKRL